MTDYLGLESRIHDVLAKKLFFVCGSFKSGTTWLQLALDCHPNVACRGEGHFFDYLAKDLESSMNEYNGKISNKNRTIFNEIDGFPMIRGEDLMFLFRTSILLLLSQFSSNDSIQAVGEKTPRNVHALPLLSDMFPEARFFHIIRDGRDVAVSGWHHNLRTTPNWLSNSYGTLSNYAVKVAKNWVDDVTKGRRFGRENPSRYFEVRYEDMLQDVRPWLRESFRFLEVAADDEVVEASAEKSSFEALSGGRRPGTIDDRSHFRVGKSGQWLDELDSDTKKRFEDIAGDVLREFGYQTS